MSPSLPQRLCAEGIGTALLLAIIVGSGIMGDTLSQDDAIALLGNTIATGAGLIILILIFAPISGAHFNPAVTLAFWVRKEIKTSDAICFIIIQIISAISGVALAHFMFDLELFQTSEKIRSSAGQTSAEAVATFGLILTILALVKTRPDVIPFAVGLFITAGYWFTSSTSFANPAVTLARSLTNTFAGIAPGSIPGFLIGQIIGTIAAVGLATWMFTPHTPQNHTELGTPDQGPPK